MRHLFIISLITITLSCCKKKNFVPDTPSGSNTIECTIDGKTFQTSGPKGGNNISCNDEVSITTGGLGGAQIMAIKCKQGTLILNFYGPLLEKKYLIQKPNTDGYISVGPFYSAQYGGNGSISILKLSDKYIYGTFEGVINASDGSKTTISKGKFDIAL